MHLKGARNVRVTQVPLKADSLNEGDVFILDAGLKLYQWNGPQASRQEKAKGLDVARRIKDEERSGRATFVLLDGTDKAAEEEFWKALGGKPAKIKTAAEGGDDTGADKDAVYFLYRVSDASGSMKMEEVGRSPLNKDLLGSDDVYILDADQEVYVWVGKGANKEERKEAMMYAAKYLTEKNKPSFTPIVRVVENAETAVFKSKFKVWPQPMVVKATSNNKVAKVEQKAVDVKGMHVQKKPQDEATVDDGSGKIEIWRIEDFKMAPLDKDSYGQFFGGDSYIVFYTYQVNKKDNWIIYMWQGAQSSTDERGACALHAKELDDKYGGAPVQVRVVQGKEPNHFLSVFKGKMVVHNGGVDSGFKNVKDKAAHDANSNTLYHVRGTNGLNTRASEVKCHASSLNSGDVFLARTKSTLYVWQGAGANDDEVKHGESIAKVLQGKKLGDSRRLIFV